MKNKLGPIPANSVVRKSVGTVYTCPANTVMDRSGVCQPVTSVARPAWASGTPFLPVYGAKPGF